MPEKKWVFDTVSLSNFLLSESIFILENRGGDRGMSGFILSTVQGANISRLAFTRAIREIHLPNLNRLISWSKKRF